MIITINIQNAAEYQWISQYLDELKSHPTIGVTVQEEDDDKWDKALADLDYFIQHRAVKVDKIEFMTREERNER